MRPKDNPSPIGGRLRKAREDLGLSQQDAAARAGLSHQIYWKYEAGRSVPKAERLAWLARVFEIRLEWLITGRAPIRSRRP